MIFFEKKFLAKKSKFFKILKIDTILYTFYSEFYADSESAIFSRFTSIFREISTVKVWPKSQKCRFLGKIRHGYGLFWSQSIDSDQGYSGPILGRYVRVCGGRCLYVLVGASCAGTVPVPCRHRTGTKSRPVSFTKGRYRAGDTMYISLVPVGADWCRSVPISRRDRRNCCICEIVQNIRV